MRLMEVGPFEIGWNTLWGLDDYIVCHADTAVYTLIYIPYLYSKVCLSY